MPKQPTVPYIAHNTKQFQDNKVKITEQTWLQHCWMKYLTEVLKSTKNESLITGKNIRRRCRNGSQYKSSLFISDVLTPATKCIPESIRHGLITSVICFQFLWHLHAVLQPGFQWPWLCHIYCIFPMLGLNID